MSSNIYDLSGRLQDRLIERNRNPSGPYPPSRVPIGPDRYDLRCWADGWAIYEDGELVTTLHGPQFRLASKIMKALKEEAQ